MSDLKGRAAIERLDRQSWQLSLLTIFVICVLGIFIVITHLDKLSGSPQDWWGRFFDGLTVNVLASAAFIFLFCVYVFWKNMELRRLRKTILADRRTLEGTAGSAEGTTPFLQVSSVISAQKELPATLELIVRESVNSLNGHRSTIFLADAEKGSLKAHSSYTPEAPHEQVSLLEEKELARKTLKQKRALLLTSPEDFAEFPNYGDRPKRITSFICIPLYSQGKAVGALSVALINGQRGFGDKDVQCLSVFANHASIALGNAELLEQARKGSDARGRQGITFEDLVSELPNRSRDELSRVREKIVSLLAANPAPENGNGAKSKSNPASPAAAGSGEQKETLKFEIEEGDLGQTEDLSSAGLFIRTSNPLDLGEQFLLRLHLPLGPAPVEISCKVIWTNKYGKESKNLHRGMGVKFLNLSADAHRRIEAFIQADKDPMTSEARQSLNHSPENGKSAGERSAVNV